MAQCRAARAKMAFSKHECSSAMDMASQLHISAVSLASELGRVGPEHRSVYVSRCVELACVKGHRDLDATNSGYF